MKRLNEMIGLPVMCGGSKVGVVASMCLSPDSRAIDGFNIRRGLRSGLFVPGTHVCGMSDKRIEIVSAQGSAAQREKELGTVCDRRGKAVGLITDAAIDEQTLQVIALEVTFGPVDDLMDGRRWIRRFTACAHGIMISVPEWERGKPS